MRRDRGSATAELAVSMPALMLLFSFGLTAVDAVTMRMRCLDAARDAALAVSRGEPAPATPRGMSLSLHREGDQVVATVTGRVGLPWHRLPPVTVAATATAADEASGIGSKPTW
jgi:hypothetical protein